jgi:hypothetical protein
MVGEALGAVEEDAEGTTLAVGMGEDVEGIGEGEPTGRVVGACVQAANSTKPTMIASWGFLSWFSLLDN